MALHAEREAALAREVVALRELAKLRIDLDAARAEIDTHLNGPVHSTLMAERAGLAKMRAERDAARAEIDAIHAARAQIDNMKDNVIVRDRDAAFAALAEAVAEIDAIKNGARSAPATRRRLPDERQGRTRKFQIRQKDGPLIKIYVLAGVYGDSATPAHPNGLLGEIFLKVDRQGSLASGAFDGFAIGMSIALQHGVPVEAFTSKMVGMQFEPAGITGDKDYPMARSVLDLVGRWLRDEYGARALTVEETVGPKPGEIIDMSHKFHVIGPFVPVPANGVAKTAPEEKIAIECLSCRGLAKPRKSCGSCGGTGRDEMSKGGEKA